HPVPALSLAPLEILRLGRIMTNAAMIRQRIRGGWSGHYIDMAVNVFENLTDFPAAQCGLETGAASGANNHQLRIEIAADFRKHFIGFSGFEVNMVVGKAGGGDDFAAIRVRRGISIGIDEMKLCAVHFGGELAR